MTTKRELHYQRVEKLKARWRAATIEELKDFRAKFPGGITKPALKKALNQVIKEKQNDN